jgi:hypothetical protein
MKKITIAMMVMLFAYSNVYAGDSLALYKEYLSALENAKSTDDVAKYMSSEVLIEFKKHPKKGEELFKFSREIGESRNIKISEEIISDDNTVLKYKIYDKVKPNEDANPYKVKVNMKRENGLWKIAEMEFRFTSVL